MLAGSAKTTAASRARLSGGRRAPAATDRPEPQAGSPGHRDVECLARQPSEHGGIRASADTASFAAHGTVPAGGAPVGAGFCTGARRAVRAASREADRAGRGTGDRGGRRGRPPRPGRSGAELRWRNSTAKAASAISRALPVSAHQSRKLAPAPHRTVLGQGLAWMSWGKGLVCRRWESAGDSKPLTRSDLRRWRPLDNHVRYHWSDSALTLAGAGHSPEPAARGCPRSSPPGVTSVGSRGAGGPSAHLSGCSGGSASATICRHSGPPNRPIVTPVRVPDCRLPRATTASAEHQEVRSRARGAATDRPPRPTRTLLGARARCP